MVWDFGQFCPLSIELTLTLHPVTAALQLRVVQGVPVVLAGPKVRIPTHAGHLFRDDVGRRSDLIPATVPR